jgi:hypothetical protein
LKVTTARALRSRPNFGEGYSRRVAHVDLRAEKSEAMSETGSQNAEIVVAEVSWRIQ